jgi:hypothetical protein
MSENSPGGSDRDRLVRDILDRVASGDLSSADAAVLLSAAPAEPDRPASAETNEPGGAAEQSAAAAAPEGEQAAASEPPEAERDETASGDVWAAAVDDPRAPAAAGGHAAPSQSQESSPGGTPQDSTAARPQDGTADRVQDRVQGGEGERLQDLPGDQEIPDTDTLDQERDEHADVPVPAGVQKVMIQAIGRRVRLIGEPAVTGVAVDGPHLIKRDGDTLIVSSDGDMGVSIDGLSMLRTRTVGDLRSHLGGFAKELSVRVNPRLRVEVEVTGGSVTAERVPALNRVRVTAGTARVSDVDGPIDLLVQAGSANLDAQLTKGRSRVRVESGSANVQLRRGSDVRVHSDAQLGRVTWVGAVNGPSTDVEIGQGRATLDVEVLMGAAQITAD